ncbi:sensor histidine kinase [Larkinella humicola]|uniref:histidine kinase n=1 Tax=Larkinella humicola TaxID=2607654 RepID=A0A5N1J4U0_9BACT|nr:sensor histidine kinase [Larkinella humicola]KAA9341085.1 sensor histidine kinase [Larkinella humicola]
MTQYSNQTRQEIQRLDRLLTKVLLKQVMPLLQGALKPELVDLVALFQHFLMHQLWQDAAYQRVIFQTDSDEVIISVEPIILEQVLENLLSNALKYSSNSNKPVEVGLETLATDIRITVKNYGIGIPAEDLEHIGKSFFRGSNSTLIAGIGLGLSLSHQFIQQHGGRLEIESQLGRYTLCTILLPRSPSYQEERPSTF